MQHRIRGLATAWAFTFVIGLIFVAVGVADAVAFNACWGDPTCFPSALNVSEFLAVLAVGIALAIAGAWVSFTRRGAASLSGDN